MAHQTVKIGDASCSCSGFLPWQVVVDPLCGQLEVNTVIFLLLGAISDQVTHVYSVGTMILFQKFQVYVV